MGMYFIYNEKNNTWFDIRETWIWLNKSKLENYCDSRGIRRY